MKVSTPNTALSILFYEVLGESKAEVGPHSLLCIDVALYQLNLINFRINMFQSIKFVDPVSVSRERNIYMYIYIHYFVLLQISTLILFKQSSFKMHFINLIALLAAPAIVAATLDPASSNTKGYKPASLNCSGA